jgi:hypothetical protein
VAGGAGDIGSQIKGLCSRIDLLKKHAGIDVQAMYPAGAPPKADDWTLDTLLKAAEACHKGGNPFGIGVGTTGDSIDTIGAFLHAYGGVLVDAKGEITVKSDPVRQALDYYKRLMAFLPADVAAWDDASNNKHLISGQGSLIMNPPSAWAVAKRDAPKVAEQCWTHGFPVGPKGRFAPFVPFFWGTWNFSKNIPAAKSLLMPRRGPPRARSSTTPTPTTIRSSRWPGRRRPTRSPSRSTPGASRPRWRFAISRVRPWRRPWTGRQANSKASCATKASGGRATHAA